MLRTISLVPLMIIILKKLRGEEIMDFEILQKLVAERNEDSFKEIERLRNRIKVLEKALRVAISQRDLWIKEAFTEPFSELDSIVRDNDRIKEVLYGK